eukprot:CAMPEP_0177650218 /NCGR_PEP_ID=MMETSP0447-20121125/11819_1 /TAXON_ID=0 /ORGANISM="Stygamoeba regulata, Strain BSH-02190019" /LENGTH=246 /DNA_ID=CAMNT_0019153061 /DNA_START=433 /DNA_END=1173 /DNA_ORIENTATION=-
MRRRLVEAFQLPLWLAPLPRAVFPSVYLRELYDYQTSSPVYKEVISLMTGDFPGDDEASPEEVKYMLSTKIYRIFVLTKSDLPTGQQVAGIICLMYYPFEGRTEVHLEYITVSKLCRSSGAGSLMLQLLTKTLRNEAAEEESPSLEYLTLECEERLVTFYNKRIAAHDAGIPPAFHKSHSDMPDPFQFMFLPLHPSSRYVPKAKFIKMRAAYMSQWAMVEAACDSSDDESSSDDSDSDMGMNFFGV